MCGTIPSWLIASQRVSDRSELFPRRDLIGGVVLSGHRTTATWDRYLLCECGRRILGRT